MHKFEVRPRDPEKIMSGANTLVFMDGVRLDRCTRFAFEVDAKGVAKISLDLLGSVVITGLVGDIQEQIIPLVPKARVESEAEQPCCRAPKGMHGGDCVG